MSRGLESAPTSRARWAVLAFCAALFACGGKSPSPPVDAGPFVIPDSGPPPCTVSCHEVPDAGTDAGYQAKPLAITAVVPHRAPTFGGASVQITGTGFMSDFAEDATDAPHQSTLLVGGNPALDYTVISDTIAEFTAPPGQPGDVDVTLTNPNGTATCPGCFTYYAPVLLQAISPTEGALAGGTQVALTGKGFTPDSTVLFGDKAAPQVSFGDAGLLIAETPAGERVGAVDVRVFNSIGTSSLRQAFRYDGAPELDSASPAGGPVGGGTTVNLVGHGLAALTGCTIGGSPAQLLIQDDSNAQLIAPAGPEGSFDITCTAPDGTATLKNAFTYFDPSDATLRLLGLGPTHGPPSGGNTVTLVGGGLNAVGGVTFGGQAATIVAQGANLLVVQVPPGTARTSVDVALDSGETLTAGYHYNLALQQVRPSHGPTAGGTALEIDGDGLASDLTVTIGGVAVQNLASTDPALITCTSPAGAGGAALVRAVSPTDPEDHDELAGGYTFDEPLAIGAVVPASGSIAGGTFVTVYGSGFAEGTVIHFGSHRAKDITVIDSHTLTAHTPSSEVGSVDVSATLDAASATERDGFSYIDTTNQGGGATGGPLGGTLNVTVLDSTFTQYGAPVVGATVTLGTDPSTPFQGQTDARGQITFSDPALIKAQVVSVTKPSYQTVTVVDQASQNLTVYIGQNDGSGGSPGGGGPSGPTPVSITGHVFGFKPPHPLQPYEHEECRVVVAPHGVYRAPPMALPDQPVAGERSVLDADGESYARLVYPGLYAVYATYGLVDERTQVFTPYLLGLARNIEASDARPLGPQDIVLDIHLDQSAPISVLNPLLVPDTPTPAVNHVYAYLDLGGEGVVPISDAQSYTPDLVISGLPQVDGENLIFLNASDVDYSPASYFFRRQPGDVRSGIALGPMLGFLSILEPSPSAPEFTGTLTWSYGDGPPPDLTQVTIYKFTPFGAIDMWDVILPGSATTVSLPASAVQALLDREPPGESLEVIITANRAPRFDYAHWTYADLGQLSWTSFTDNYALLQLPGGGP